MKYYNLGFLIIISLLLSGCIGPLYNPYPLSKVVAKVGPPLKLSGMSVEEQINAEILAEKKENVEDATLTDDNTSSLTDSTDVVEDSFNELDIEVIDAKTLVAKWDLDVNENLILPPLDIVKAVNEKCLNGNTAQLITFSSSEGTAEAKYKCW